MARCRECNQEFEGAQQETCPYCGAARPRPAIRRPAATAAPPEDWSTPAEGFEEADGGWTAPTEQPIDPDGGWNTPLAPPAESYSEYAEAPPSPMAPVRGPRSLPQGYMLSPDLDVDQSGAVDTPEWRAARKTVIGTTVASIGMALAIFIVSRTLLSDDTAQLYTRLNIGTILTVLLYVIVSFIVAFQLSEGKIKPEYAQPGEELKAIAIGFAVGLFGAIAIVALNSVLVGRVMSDQNMMALFFEKAWIHAGVMVAIAVIAAPLVEELLYRGLLAESLRPKGRGSALFLSAIAFSLWHLNPQQFRYYVFMGFILGALYWRFGLNGSITAHAAFNATLAVFALIAVSGDARVERIGDLSITLPPGWRLVDQEEVPGLENVPLAIDIAAETPTGSGFVVMHIDKPPSPIPGVNAMPPLTQLLPPGSTGATEIAVGEGKGLRFSFKEGPFDADGIITEQGARVYLVSFVSGGSTEAERHFDEMFRSISFPIV